MFNVSYGITWLVVKCVERRERGRERGEREIQSKDLADKWFNWHRKVE